MQVPLNNTFNLRMLNLALKFKSEHIAYRNQVFSINNSLHKSSGLSHYIKNTFSSLYVYMLAKRLDQIGCHFFKETHMGTLGPGGNII